MSNGEPRVTIGQVGQSLMRYWQAIALVAFLIATGAVMQFQIRLHGDAIKAINVKLDANANETAQWDMLMANGTDIRENDTRLDEVEKHITPDSIQAWGAFKASVTRIDSTVTDHLRNHP